MLTTELAQGPLVLLDSRYKKTARRNEQFLSSGNREMGDLKIVPMSSWCRNDCG